MGVYGAADSTLVNMSYHAAKANVPLDQTAIFKQREENLTAFTGAVSKLFENQWQDHKATEKIRKQLAQDTREILMEGGNINEFQIDNNYNFVMGLKDELDAIKFDRTLDKRGKEKARQALELKMAKYKNQITEQKLIFEEMVGFSADGLVYSDAHDSPESKTWNAILEDYNNGTNTAKQIIDPKTGEISYEFEGKTMSLKDIKKGLSKHDPEFQQEFTEKLNNIVGQFKSFQTEGIDPTPEQLATMKETLFKGINTMDQVRNLANMKLGNNRHSFEQILMGQAKVNGLNGHEMIDNQAIELIWAELDRLGGIDMDGDGDIDKDDREGELGYHDPKNAKLLIEKIKQDPDTYKELVVNFTMENAVKDIWAQGMMERTDAHRIQAAEDARELEIDRQKKMNTQRAAAWKEDRVGRKEKKRDERFEADDKRVRDALAALSAGDKDALKEFAGKRTGIRKGESKAGEDMYIISIDGVESKIDKNKMTEEKFNTFVYNKLMSHWEKTRNTKYAS